VQDSSLPPPLARLPARCLAAALLYITAFPPFDLSWAALLAPAPLALLLLDPARPLRPWHAALAGLLFGWAFALGGTGAWIAQAALRYFEVGGAEAAALAIGFTGLHVALFTALLALFASRLHPLSPIARVVAFAFTWTAWDFARASLLGGNPWGLLGQAFHDLPSSYALIRLGGTWLPGWLAAAFGGALAVTWIENQRLDQALRSAAVAGAVLVVFVLSALVGLPAADEQGLSPLKVAVIQPGLGQHDLWDPAKKSSHLDLQLELSRRPELADARLIVWPEAAIPRFFDASSKQRVEELARQQNAAVLLGSVRNEDRGDGRAHLYNSAYFFDPAVGEWKVYDKMRLLQWMEYRPGWLPGANPLDYLPGSKRVLFELDGWSIAPLICFEAVFAGASRSAARAGADLLVNLSNDSWFDAGAGRLQHLAFTTPRTVENGLPLLRSTTTGSSVLLAADASLAGSLRPGSARVGLFVVQPGPGPGPYSLGGDWLPWLSVLLMLAALGAAAQKKRPAAYAADRQ